MSRTRTPMISDMGWSTSDWIVVWQGPAAGGAGARQPRRHGLPGSHRAPAHAAGVGRLQRGGRQGARRRPRDRRRAARPCPRGPRRVPAGRPRTARAQPPRAHVGGPRTARLFQIAEENGLRGRYARLMELVHQEACASPAKPCPQKPPAPSARCCASSTFPSRSTAASASRRGRSSSWATSVRRWSARWCARWVRV